MARHRSRQIARVFPRRTPLTPDDEMAFVGDPPSSPFLPDRSCEVRVSCAFTWDKKETNRIAGVWRQHGYRVRVGGPAYRTPARDFVPGMYLRRGVTITSRGCPRRCPWCVVPSIEGNKMRELPILPGNIIQDNNLLACRSQHIFGVFEMLGSQRRISFPGGLDVRLLKRWHVDELEALGSRIHEMWFAADAPYWGALEKAADMLRGFARRKKRCYVLMGHEKDTPEQAAARLWRVRDLGFLPFAQLYRGKGEQERTRRWRRLQRAWTRPAAMAAMAKERDGQA